MASGHRIGRDGIDTVAITEAPTTEVMARIVPTERSKPPVRSANICPSETIIR